MIKHFLVLFIISLTLISCSEKNNQPESKLSEKDKFSFDSSDVKADGVDNSGKPFLLQYKFKKGDDLVYRLTTISNNSQKIVADSTITSNADQKVIYLLNINIKDVDEDGNSEADVKITSLRLDANVNGKLFSFETGKDTSKEDVKKFAEFQALYNNPFSIRFNKMGEILEVYKVDKILNTFIDLRGAKDSVNAEQKGYVKEDLINSVLNPLVTQIFRKFPDKEVYKDSTWETQQKPMPLMVYRIDYTNKYKLENVEKIKDNRVAVINIGVAFTYTGQPKVTQGNAQYSFQKPVSTAEGKIFFDVERGLQIKARTKTNISISYEMQVNTPTGKKKGTQSENMSNINIIELL